MTRFFSLLIFAWILAAVPGATSAAEPGRKPAVLFLSLNMPAADGGAAMRENLARLDRLGYRVGYSSFESLREHSRNFLQKFDVVVLLQQPNREKSLGESIGDARRFYEDLEAALGAGVGVLVFPSELDIRGAKAFWEVVRPYGAWPLAGTLVDKSPVLGSFGVIWYARTTRLADSPLTQNVKSLWYPVAGPVSNIPRFNLGTLRNANTVPFAFDANWTGVAEAGPGTSFVPLPYEDPWIREEKFREVPAALSLLAVRDGVIGGRGRMAVCAINSVFSDFIAGNGVYGGICTAKGLEGKPSDLDTLLMNTIHWLGAPSLEAGRETIPESLRGSYVIERFQFPAPLKNPGARPMEGITEQFRGVIGVRSTYSGGASSVAEYAASARKLGMDYLVFLEDYEKLSDEDFEKLKKECAANSDEKLLLLPGIRAKNVLGTNFFGFKTDLKLPIPLNLAPGTKRLTTRIGDGQHVWSTTNGGRTGMACGNFGPAGEATSGMPASDFKTHNPFISLFTYKDGKLSDSLLETYFKCAARTEWVSPIAIDLIDSASALESAWKSDTFKTVWLRDAGSSVNALKQRLGERTPSYAPVTYVTNGPRIDEWRGTETDFDGALWDWTRYPVSARMVVSSEAGLKEIKLMDGRREIRRFLPGGAKRFEQTVLFTHNDMHNLILVVTDNAGRQAISDEIWTKNRLLQLTWCQDRNNMLGSQLTLAPLSPIGSTAGNYAVPFSMEKSGFRESLVPPINQDLSRLPGYDGQPYGAAFVSPAPVVAAEEGTEGGRAIARDIGRLLSAPDAAIQTAEAVITAHKDTPRPAPGRPGPMVPLSLFNADLRYTTFAHPGHLSTPVLFEGTIKILKDLHFAEDVPMGIRVLEMSFPDPSDYERIAVRHSRTGDRDEPLTGSTKMSGALNRGAFLLAHPSFFGAVGIFSLDDNLDYDVRGGKVAVGFRLAGQTLQAGTELKFRAIVFASGREAILPPLEEAEQFASRLGVRTDCPPGYEVKATEGTVTGRDYVLTLDGKGSGFLGEIVLSDAMPCVLPIVVENLNPRWSSVLYDRRKKVLRPLGMVKDRVYGHRLPSEKDGEIFIGHPFTSDNPDLVLSAAQTGGREITLQAHNPTDHPITASVKRSPAFDFIGCGDLSLEVPAGQTVETVLR